MEARTLARILAVTYLAMLIGMLQFGRIIGEGRVIDVVVHGLMQVFS